MKREARIGKHVSDNCRIQNGVRKGDALSPLLLNFALEHAITKVQENQVGLKLIGTHQLLAYADYTNLLGDKKYTIDKNSLKLFIYGLQRIRMCCCSYVNIVSNNSSSEVLSANVLVKCFLGVF
jgi:hypothetical protein